MTQYASSLQKPGYSAERHMESTYDKKAQVRRVPFVFRERKMRRPVGAATSEHSPRAKPLKIASGPLSTSSANNDCVVRPSVLAIECTPALSGLLHFQYPTESRQVDFKRLFLLRSANPDFQPPFSGSYREHRIVASWRRRYRDVSGRSRLISSGLNGEIIL